MFRLFVDSVAHLLVLTYRTLIPQSGQARPSLRRRLTLACFIPLFALVQGIHWLGFLLDEVLYPSYRRVRVRAPLFVLGVPRSGTTHLHRILAEDEQFTTFSTWECLFGLSITARRFWIGIGRLDRPLGRPLGRLLSWLERHAFSAMDDVHSMRLSDPEEDYFAFMPALACFILVLPFAHSERLWQMGAFDREMPALQRRRLMDYYHRCLQKHLYVHGPHKRLLSKNAAFAPLAGSLLERFPDARFIVCLRPPEQTLPSQLSSIESGIALFDALSAHPNLRDRLIRQLGFYYENLHRVFAQTPDDQCVWVTMRELKASLDEAIERSYRQLELQLSEPYRMRLQRHQARARTYRSGHSYSLEQFDLSRTTIEATLGPIYEALIERTSPSTSPPTGAPNACSDLSKPSRTTEPALPC